MVENPEGPRIFGGPGAGHDDECLVDAASIQQSAGHVPRDGAVSQLFRGVAGHVGIDVTLRVGHVRQDHRPGEVLVAPNTVLRRRGEPVASVGLQLLLAERSLGPVVRDRPKMVETLVTKSVRRRRNDPVELAVARLGHGVENAVRQRDAIHRDPRRHR